MDTGLTTAPPVERRALPDPAPLPMPTQSLRAAPPRRGRLPSSPRAIGLRRFLVIGSAIALTA
ncbi:MAG: hypothetical protein J0H99_22075, partial [Rhodospirillales bacterium]|nr:hypothetical protein [Rhodospirillales bacterium]